MFFRKKIGIDLGTANTLVYVAGEGIVLNEPTVVAYSLDDKKILAVGEDAREMIGRTPGAIVASRPMKEGVIADYTTTSAMITYFLKKGLRSAIFWPEVMISIPGGSSQVEKRAVVAACKQAGASDVYLIEEPLAAAIGAKLPISQASGQMIVNIGGGTTEIAVISLGQLVVYKTVRVAGTKLDEAIMTELRKKHNMIIGERTAEDIKIKIGSATSLAKEETLQISGRDLVFGLPRTVSVTSTAITEAIRPVLLQIISAVKAVLEDTPPELAADIIDKGIVMSGGTSLLRNFDKLMTEETGVPVHVGEDALFCVVRGTAVAMENIELWKRTITTKA